MPDYKFWNDRWMNNQIGFHQMRPHKSLVEFYHHLAPYKKIFVPLCGKSLDMIFLRDKGHEVVGVEFSELAVLSFFGENNLVFEKKQVPHFTLYESTGIKIYQGDFFHLESSDLSEVEAVYDRASMVAFNYEERVRYSKHLKGIALDLKVMLSPLLDYGKIEESGPPYSVTEAELRDLYGDEFDLVLLKAEEFSVRPTLIERGVLYEKEVSWLFKRRSL
ncbi:MAG: thiopurine S-methyltransferase [Bacteriovorax sp.]